MKNLVIAIIMLLAGVSSAGTLVAQTDVLRVAIANMSQDISLLSQQLQSLNLEIEALQRENERLRAKIIQLSSGSNTQAQMAVLTDAIDTLRQEYRRADDAQKTQIIAEVSRQINGLAQETQSALRSMAEVMGSAPSVATPVHFSEDYPKTGKPYVVQKGDTLSGIARKYGSTIKYIQNANKIANPARDLLVGETIFIPIPE